MKHHNNLPYLASLAAVVCALSSASAKEAPDALVPLTVEDEALAPEWGLAMAVRYANVPYKSSSSSTDDVMPLFYYEGERFFLRGDYAGVKLWENEYAGFNAIGRYRFLDIPNEYKQIDSGVEGDLGIQAFYKLDDNSQVQFEVLSDVHGRMQSAVRFAGDYRTGGWRFFPEAQIGVLSSDFNSHYYGLDSQSLSAGLNSSAKLKVRRQLISNLHLEGQVKGSWLGNQAGKSDFVEDNFAYELYLGLGFFDAEPVKKSSLEAKPFWKIAHGWGTTSNFESIPSGSFDTEDDADVTMTSIFYGHPLSDTLFGAPIELYLTPGFVVHHSSDVQASSYEGVLAVKLFYTLPTPWRIRLGAAEGISYASNLNYYERTDLAGKGEDESQLMNYLNISADINLADVFNFDPFEELWLGVGVHHRSGIYGSSSAFNSISGGSNYGTVFLQWHGGGF
ncbi:MipA/OmpV family protein [Rubritalea marina]|uniref:MipA/OmpV family protein n=1 Tax=Rubritalea marina TaxID=361055 RepID=UPI000374049C|nr:MipA/OmpV family protein [Rubritalea marina]